MFDRATPGSLIAKKFRPTAPPFKSVAAKSKAAKEGGLKALLAKFFKLEAKSCILGTFGIVLQNIMLSRLVSVGRLHPSTLDL